MIGRWTSLEYWQQWKRDKRCIELYENIEKHLGSSIEYSIYGIGLWKSSKSLDFQFVKPRRTTWTLVIQLEIHELLSIMWNAALKTADSIRTGLPQAKLDYSDMSQKELRQFFCGEHPYAVEKGRDLVERYDFSSCSTLLDVGGGSGGLAIAVTEACPHIQATVVDLPNVTPVTQHYIDEAGARNRVKVVTADVVRDSLPDSYDAAVMTAFIQALSPDDARCAIKNVSKVMNPGVKST